MPRFLPLFTGLALATAVTFKFKEILSKDQADVHQRLENVKATLDNAVTPKHKAFVSNSQKYVSERFVPSVKDSWNKQLINATHSLVKVDLGAKAKKFLDEQFK